MAEIFNVDDLLTDVFQQETLIDIFNKRLVDLNISATSAAALMDIDYRSLLNILHASKKIVDFTNIIKLASFVHRPKAEILQLYVNALEANFPDESRVSPEQIKFIKANFDLASLKKAGFISSITDFNEINSKLTSALGLSNIMEYQRPSGDVAFSAGTGSVKNENNRLQWIGFARDTFEEIANPNEYDRHRLTEYFPKLRWHCTDVSLGLPSVMKELYKCGVTVIYQDALPALKLRGATFAVNDKPCVVLTNYRGYYPTLFFALIHELFHVLFDWDDILKNRYHLSDDDDKDLSIRVREDEADQFAREYLFSKEKTAYIRPYLKTNHSYVEKFCRDNHVHPSFPYVFYANDVGKSNRWAWAWVNDWNPKAEMVELLKYLGNRWDDKRPIGDHAKFLKTEIFN